MKIMQIRRMRRRSHAWLKSAMALSLALPVLSWAHTGADASAHHGSSLMLGLLHPWTGVDHLLAMLAVGIWSALTMRRVWLAPAAFAVMVGLGALTGLAASLSGVWPTVVEAGIASSLVVIGLLVSLKLQLPEIAGAALVSVFALFHGYAHGTEFTGAGRMALVGVMISTAALHLLGIGLGMLLRRQHRLWAMAGGAVTTLTGLGLLVQLS